MPTDLSVKALPLPLLLWERLSPWRDAPPMATW